MKHNDLKIKKPILLLALFILPLFSFSMSLEERRVMDARLLAPPPGVTPTITYPGSPFCKSVTFGYPAATNTTPAAPGINHQYSSSGNLSIGISTGIIDIGASQPGTFTVQYFEGGPNSCSCFTFATVVINPLPVISIVNTPTVCENTPISLLASGANTYTWNGFYTSNPFPFTSSGNATVTVVGTSSLGCQNTKIQAITVKPYPDVLIVPSSTVVCEGSAATMTAFVTNVISPISYSWSPGSLTTSVIPISPTVNTTYVLIADNGGCKTTKPQFVFVEKSYDPNTAFSYPNPICSNASGNPIPGLDSAFVRGGRFYSTDGIKINSASGLITLAGIEPGQYSVSYSLAAKGCTRSAERTEVIVINPGGNLVASPDISIFEGTGTPLTVTGGNSYNWGPGDYLSCFDCDSPIATPLESTVYCASDLADACLIKACVKVEVLCLSTSDFGVPNAFTPNDDKINDKFCLQGWEYCVADFKVVIYDRWGEKVFESTDSSFCWDGIYNGKLLNSGVYVYAISATVNHLSLIKKGNITLIR